jgi:hypothetical protein
MLNSDLMHKSYGREESAIVPKKEKSAIVN